MILVIERFGERRPSTYGGSGAPLAARPFHLKLGRTLLSLHERIFEYCLPGGYLCGDYDIHGTCFTIRCKEAVACLGGRLKLLAVVGKCPEKVFAEGGDIENEIRYTVDILDRKMQLRAP
jgi:hypothetical protein